MLEYLYVDEKGIKSLYSQLSDQTAIGSHKGAENSGSLEGGGSFSMGLGSLLQMLRIADIGGNISMKGAKSTKQSETTDYTMSVENQAAAVWKYLNQQRTLYQSPYDAANAARVSRHGAFCQIDGVFKTRGAFPDVNSWLKRANETGYATLELEVDPTVFMSMSISKIIETGRNEILPDSHFGHRIRHGKTRLTVWGRMDATKYIKPYIVAY